MPIIGAYVVPHPPLAVPAVGGGKEGAIHETLRAMEYVAAAVAKKRPDTLVYLTPHGTVFGDYFHISAGAGAAGDFSRFGAAGVTLRAEYDAELVSEISREAHAAGFPAGSAGEAHADAALDHGVTVPMYYVNRKFPGGKIVRVSLSGLDAAAHFRMGEIISRAVRSLARRVVVIASGDLSHKLAETGPYGYAPEGEIFDRDVMKYLGEGDFAGLLAMDKSLCEKAAECGYGSFAILAGCLQGENIAVRRLSYEAPFGVGYGVVAFEVEDAFRALARRSLEFRVKTGREMPFPENLPQEFLDNRAGAFVSLHKDGALRGCIGTIAPTKATLAEEIMQNAVSAALYDPRFPPVHESELPHLVYKVDILDAPEEIPDATHLDVKKYGVIVESGFKRGLLLPNLDGIDTIDYQIEIACQKAGIAPGEKVSLKRFKVTRYE